MVKSTNTQGFTLVELIIVITILAILATIAFISFQGYSREARNSKRASDLNSIVRAIEIKTGADGAAITNFATDISTAHVGTGSIGGRITFTADQYKAGDVNFTALGNVDAPSFKDPSEKKDYKIGVTSLAGGAYQLAAIKEEEGGKSAYVVGTYKQRTTDNVATGTVSNKVITLTDGFGLLKKGDLLNGNVEVLSVSSDLTRLTLSGTISDSSTAAAFYLAANEKEGLVAGNKGTATGAVINGEDYLPY